MSDEEFYGLLSSLIAIVQRAHRDAKRTGTDFVTNISVSEKLLDALKETQDRLKRKIGLQA